MTEEKMKEIKHKPLTREELELIRDRAELMARTPMLNSRWKAAFLDLSQAADYISLIQLRTEINDI